MGYINTTYVPPKNETEVEEEVQEESGGRFSRFRRGNNDEDDKVKETWAAVFIYEI